jgi:hypothetical protein
VALGTGTPAASGSNPSGHSSFASSAASADRGFSLDLTEYGDKDEVIATKVVVKEERGASREDTPNNVNIKAIH